MTSIMDRTLDVLKEKAQDLLPRQNGQLMVGVDSFSSFARIYLKKNPKLLQVKFEDLVPEFFKAARDGLIVDGRESAILPFTSKKTGVVSAQYVPMLSGSLKMIYRTGMVSSVNVDVVYESDLETFEEVRGTEPKIIHSRKKAPSGSIVASYAVAQMKSGGQVFAVVYQPDIDVAKKTSKSDVWTTHPSEMWKKTAVHRLRKLMPVNMIGSESIEYNEDRNEYDDAIDVEASQKTPIHELGDMPELIDSQEHEYGVNERLSELARA